MCHVRFHHPNTAETSDTGGTSQIDISTEAQYIHTKNTYMRILCYIYVCMPLHAMCAYEDTGDVHKHQSTESRVVTYAAAALEARDTRQSIRSIRSIVAHADHPFFFNQSVSLA
jgi:hypothetical protein